VRGRRVCPRVFERFEPCASLGDCVEDIEKVAKASGAKTDRPELAKAIDWLETGDALVVTRLDRLARSTRVKDIKP
jgi:DNA invertase Pin-like site-specific DNA recombinase